MHDIDAATATWLTSPAGLDEVATTTARLDAGTPALHVAQWLRERGHDQRRTSAVLGAATARRRARDRWPDADQLLFTREALEQASDPQVARWRARRLAVEGRPVMDVCAGIGGDALALAELGARVMAVDHVPGRLVLLEHNARVRGLEVATHVADALATSAPPGWWVHADPGRRRGERRVRALREHLPPVPDLVARFGAAPGVGIVLSPAVDLDDPDLPDGELEFVQLAGSLVEAVVWLGEARQGGVRTSCTLLPDELHLERRGAPTPLPVAGIGEHLVEVAPAAVRARLHDELGERIGAHRVSSNRALLTLDDPPPASPWYETRRVEAVLPAHGKAVRRWLRSAPPLPLEIVMHGVDGSPERWWRDIGRPPRGPVGRRLELIRTGDGALAVVTILPGATETDATAEGDATT